MDIRMQELLKNNRWKYLGCGKWKDPLDSNGHYNMRDAIKVQKKRDKDWEECHFQ